jgi:hypothetical protein
MQRESPKRRTLRPGSVRGKAKSSDADCTQSSSARNSDSSSLPLNGSDNRYTPVAGDGHVCVLILALNPSMRFARRAAT